MIFSDKSLSTTYLPPCSRLPSNDSKKEEEKKPGKKSTVTLNKIYNYSVLLFQAEKQGEGREENAGPDFYMTDGEINK